MSRSSGWLDDRDRAVLERLEVGQAVTPEAIKALYRRHTDVRRPRTLQRRVKELMANAPFEKTGFRRWEYQGLE